MSNWKSWTVLSAALLPTAAFATWQVAGSPVVVHSVAPNQIVTDFPMRYYDNPALKFRVQRGSLRQNVEIYLAQQHWRLDWQLDGDFPVLMNKITLAGPNISYVMNLLFAHYPVSVIYDGPERLVTVMPAAAAKDQGFWASNQHAFYKVYEGINPSDVQPAGLPLAQIPPALLYVAKLHPGSLRANVEAILKDAGWTTVIWRLPYDYNWVGYSRVHATSVQTALESILQNYPVQAVFYDMNHVVVIESKTAE